MCIHSSLISALLRLGGQRQAPAGLFARKSLVTPLWGVRWAPGPVWTSAEKSKLFSRSETHSPILPASIESYTAIKSQAASFDIKKMEFLSAKLRKRKSDPPWQTIRTMSRRKKNGLIMLLQFCGYFYTKTHMYIVRQNSVYSRF